MATKADKSDKADKPDKAKKTIIDVSHADETPPSPNSKSVIVPNRPILKDPMVVEDGAAKPDPTKPVKIDKKEMPAPASLKEPTVAELADAAASKDKAVAEKTDEPDASAAEAPAKADEKPTEETAKPDKVEEKPESEPAKKQAADDAPTEEATDKPKEPDQAAIEAEAAEQAKHDAAIEKLIESKQYYLPIETVEKRRSKRFVGLGVLLSLLLLVAWADVALDSGIISNSANFPHTHFFNLTASSANVPPAKTSATETTSTKVPKQVNPQAQKAAKKFITAIHTKDKTTAVALETPASKAADQQQSGVATFYDACQASGDICQTFFAPAFIDKATESVKTYTAKNGVVGQAIIYAQKAQSGSSQCKGSSGAALELDLVPIGQTWLVDSVNPTSDSGIACG